MMLNCISLQRSQRAQRRLYLAKIIRLSKTPQCSRRALRLKQLRFQSDKPMDTDLSLPFRATEFDGGERFVTADPGQMSGRGEGDISGTQVGFGAIIHSDMHAPRQDINRVVYLTALCRQPRFHVEFPVPTRLVSQPRDACPVEVDNIGVIFLACADFIRCIESFDLQVTFYFHLVSLYLLSMHKKFILRMLSLHRSHHRRSRE
jgi:hypothetical protein